MKFLTLDKCCYCVSLRTAVRAFAYLGLLGILQFIGLILTKEPEGRLQGMNKFYHDFPSVKVLVYSLYLLHGANSLILLYGICNNVRSCIIFWVFFYLAVTFTGLGIGMAAFIHLNVGQFACVLILPAMVALYFAWIGYSYYHEMKDSASSVA